MSLNTSPELEINSTISEFSELVTKAGLSFELYSLTKDQGDSWITTFLDATNVPKIGKLLEEYDVLLRLTARVIAISEDESRFSELKIPPPPILVHDGKENIGILIRFMYEMRAGLAPLIEAGISERHQDWLLGHVADAKLTRDKGFYYEFTDGDLDRIQELLNELRDELSSSQLFEQGHKQRLLRRLEKLQSEMHKRVADIDRFWGLVGDAGVALGKFGSEAKPFVDRVKEISQIVWRTQARAEELPSGSSNPLLEHGDAGST